MTLAWYILLLLQGAVVAVAVAWSARQRRHIRGSRPFVVFMLMLALWCFAYALELAVSDVQLKLFVAKLQYLAIPFVTPLALLFLLSYHKYEAHRTFARTALLFLVPLITSAMIWIRPEWIWQEVSQITVGGRMQFDFRYGPFFFVNWVYSYVIYTAVTILIARIAIRSPRLTRRQAALLVAGALAPWVGNIIYVFEIEQPLQSYDLTPILLGSFGLAAAYTLFEFRWLDRSPIVYDVAIENLPEAVITLDSQNRVLSANPVARRWTNRALNDVYKQPVTRFLPQEWRDLLEKTDVSARHIREVIYRHGERDYYLELRILPVFDRRARLTGRLLLVRDITERKLARLELEQRVAERTAELRAANEQLLRASHMKDAFLASMSHELRTPLNTVLVTIEALQEEIYGELTPRQDVALTRVEESAQHLLSLITDILDVSKIEAGQLQIVPVPLSIADVCQSSINLMRASARKKEIDLSLSVDVTREQIYADERRLRQILLNLLSNAVKFTENGGRAGLVVSDAQDERETHFCVWDSGIGIAEEDQEHLFKPFVQLDHTLARRYEGSGLGLALSQRLAQLHGGAITVESAPGSGSRFTLIMPWGAIEADAAHKEPLHSAA